MSKEAEIFYSEYDLKDLEVEKGDIVISERDLIECMQAYADREKARLITGDFIQYLCVELTGKELSHEDMESIIHDYVHPKN